MVIQWCRCVVMVVLMEVVQYTDSRTAGMVVDVEKRVNSVRDRSEPKS